MRMLRTCINEQVTENIITETGLREHTLHCSPDKFFRSVGENLLRCCKPLSTRISGVTGINTVGHLLSTKGDFLSIDNDYIVSAINVRSVARLCLATKDKSNA